MRFVDIREDVREHRFNPIARGLRARRLPRKSRTASLPLPRSAGDPRSTFNHHAVANPDADHEIQKDKHAFTRRIGNVPPPHLQARRRRVFRRYLKSSAFSIVTRTVPVSITGSSEPPLISVITLSTPNAPML